MISFTPFMLQEESSGLRFDRKLTIKDAEQSLLGVSKTVLTKQFYLQKKKQTGAGIRKIFWVSTYAVQRLHH